MAWGRLANRFSLQGVAGNGGMGCVYRALDELSGEVVALKMLKPADGSIRRFRREARLLAELRHPCVVRYVTHGVSDGQAFLAMEWLDGEDLRARLTRGALPVDQAVVLGQRVCDGLSALHARGIVHRDIKPENIFLPRGEVERAKIVDLGIARELTAASSVATRDGMIVGTVGYMAPEQVRGRPDLDGRADIFSLGCVLYECLTGRPAFAGCRPLAVLAKLLIDDLDPEALSVLPDQLSGLIRGLLAKDREKRPRSASSVARALGDSATSAPPAATERRRAVMPLRDSEQRIVFTILAGSATHSDHAVPSHDGHLEREVELLSNIARDFGGNATFLGGGDVIISIDGEGGPAARSSRAAICALKLAGRFPHRPFVLTSGLSHSSRHGVRIGDSIDGAARLLEDPRSAGDVTVDPVTAALLRGRFDIALRGEGLVVRGMSQQLPRRLLGREVPLIGRDRELGFLCATLDEAGDDRVGRAVLVTGPPGIGKSRLAGELAEEARRRSSLVLTARADPIAAGAPGAIARQLVRRAAGLGDGDDGVASLREHIALLPITDGDDLVEGLSELLGLQVSSEPSERLRLARQDPGVMHHWLGSCFGRWLAAACARIPTVIILEDLHWVDAASVFFVERALEECTTLPLFVLALARPEYRDRFPRLWSSRDLSVIELHGLSDRAAEALVRAAVPSLPDHDVALAVGRAGGNAFFLEEIVRALATGSGRIPETVLAMAQERIERATSEQRRLVRAASVFGQACWAGGVARVLGQTEESVRGELDQLVDDELLDRRSTSRYREDQEYLFRHALLRDAAYAMLPAIDRSLAHGRAAAWLEEHGEDNAAVLANHYECSDNREMARHWLLEATHAALAAGDSPAVVGFAERGAALVDSDHERARYLFPASIAHAFAARWDRVLDSRYEVLSYLERGTTDWVMSRGGIAYGSVALDDREVLDFTLDHLGRLEELPPPSNFAAFGIMLMAVAAAAGRGFRAARPYLVDLHRLAKNAPQDPAVNAWAKLGSVDVYRDRDLGGAVRGIRTARELFERAGEPLGRSLSAGFSSILHACAGDTADADHWSERAASLSRDGGLHTGSHFGELGTALVRLTAEPDEAEQRAAPLLGARDTYVSAPAHFILGQLAAARGDLAAARPHATSLRRVVYQPARGLAALLETQIALLRGELDDAQERLEEALGLLACRPSLPVAHTLAGELRIRLHLARADRTQAASAARDAQRRLKAISDGLEEDRREGFWQRAPFVDSSRAMIERALASGCG